ncbi:hypothetical protein Spica_0228 [Gracilinema caldarium DSM 7334]|uniref:Uncharacterized protein n=2 Tax=Gracilinema caldarium TaxID=215591 RepID=F8EYG4_GRAC1|nr:hypothetical protein Spica_0228 [Gracilinema caldarium DSM 7334]
MQELLRAHFWTNLVLTLYGTLIIGIHYAVRKKVLTIFRVPLLLILLSGLSVASVYLFERIIPLVPPEHTSSSTITLKMGTILISPQQKEVLLTTPKEPVLIKALLPKGNGLISSIIKDGKDLGYHAASFWTQGYISFALFVVLLLYFVSSLGPVLSISGWPLANLLLGFLLARFSLWIQNFLFLEPVVQIITTFINPILQEPFHRYTALFPLVVLGTFIHIFALLLYLSKDRKQAHG